MPYAELASQATIDRTFANLKERNIHPQLVQNKAEAMAAIKKLIPDGAAVMTGSSTTLDQIGFIELLKSGQHPWNNLKHAIVQEQDATRQEDLRRQSVLSSFWLGSIHALTEDGQALIASASGSQIPAYAFTAENVIWVVGTQKIVPTLEEAFKRVNEYVFPREDARMKSTGAPGSTRGKWLIFEREIMPRQVHLLLVNEVLGF
jgi:L-lactate utilization protein LutC